MTCIVALESAKMNQIIKVSSKAASMPKGKNVCKEGGTVLSKGFAICNDA